ncbi:MAG: hypothetical protein ACRDTM_01260 [Micromonosporaceae bacterium]
MDSPHQIPDDNPGAAGGGRHALIVANDEYADPELRRLAAPAADPIRDPPPAAGAFSQ